MSDPFDKLAALLLPLDLRLPTELVRASGPTAKQCDATTTTGSHRASRLSTRRIRTVAVAKEIEAAIAIDWDHLSQPEFDRIVEALLDRLYDGPDVEVIAYDGRGGDGGRDVLIRQNGRSRIFQLKYFRDGFPAERRTRRRQITRSFDEAMKHNPAEWILVIPTNPTPGEEKFVRDLGNGRLGLKVTIMARHRLDSHLARYPDLVAYFTRDSLLHQAEVYNQEKALLMGGLPDLTERHRRLAGVADTLDPDWAVDTATHGLQITHKIRPKHARAMLKSPIILSVNDAFGPQHGDLHRAFKRITEFGTNESVVLPPDVAKRLTITGPDWLPDLSGGFEISADPDDISPEVGQTAFLHVLNSDGHHRSSYRTDVVHAGTGSNGYSLNLRLDRETELELLIGEDQTDFRGKFGIHQTTPAAALETLALHRDLLESTHFAIEIEGRSLRLHRAGEPVVDSDVVEALQDLELLAEDLDIVQRHCRVRFPIPTALSATQRIDLRVARLLIEGHCVVYRGARTFTATLNGTFDPPLKALISSDSTAIRIDQDIELKIDNKRLPLGQLMFFHTRVQFESPEETLAALEAGTANGKQVRLSPLDGDCYHAIIPAARPGRDDEPLIPTPWGLPGGLDGPSTYRSPDK
jgi:hypothetical protein